MKPKYINILMSFLILAGSTSCDDEKYGIGEGEATLVIEPEISTEITTTPISRATDAYVDQENLMQKLNIVVSTPKGNAICYWNSSTGFPWKDDTESAMEYKLNSGSYVVEGWTGDSIAASWTRRYFKGKQSVTLKAGTRTSVRLTCKIVNTAVEVNYSDQIDDVLSHYTLVVTTASTSLNFEGREERTGYFMLPTKSHDMDWVFNGIRKDGTNIHMHGTINDAKASTKYSFRIKYEDPGVQYGGSAIKIDVDESTMDVEHEVQFRTRPEVTLLSIDQETQEPVHSEVGEDKPYIVYKNEVGELQLLTRSSGRITSVDMEMQGMGSLLPSGVMNIYGSQDATVNCNKLSDAGISCEYIDDTSNKVTSFPIVFSSTLTNGLEKGLYKCILTIKDESYDQSETMDEKEVSKTFALMITVDEPGSLTIETPENLKSELFESEMLFIGQTTGNGVNEVGFYVREKGSNTAWEYSTYVQGTTSVLSREIGRNVKFYAKPRVQDYGLKFETEYEYIAAFNRIPSEMGTYYYAKTGFNKQLPNAGFEEWQDSSAPFLIYGSGDAMFWDSGNHGSATLSKNVTTPETNIKHSGKYSVKLQSQKVSMLGIGKFAAGNVFIGKYLKTDGMDGILGWGREWKTDKNIVPRPRQLKGYVKYTPATIEYFEDKLVPDEYKEEYKKGNLDKGIIYIAMLSDDMSTQGDSEYKEYPVVVRTKDSHLFDKNASNVIAYGELVLDKATEGSEMIEFTIDLDYRRMDIRPSYIMLTASASKGGDYFTGGNSVMYLDDLELVY